jgi:RNA polymerase sigma factor (sigma-70 family)
VGSTLDSRSDVELLESSRNGSGGFDVFYTRHCRAVLAFHARQVREPELAADLTAETFASALLALRDRKRRLPDSPVAWLFTIAQRKLLDSYRHGQVEDRARRKLAFEPMQVSDDGIARLEQEIAATDLLAHLATALPADQFEALRARVIDELPYREIAQDLRCSESLARMRVSRALRSLRSTTLQAQREPHDG